MRANKRKRKIKMKGKRRKQESEINKTRDSPDEHTSFSPGGVAGRAGPEKRWPHVPKSEDRALHQGAGIKIGLGNLRRSWESGYPHWRAFDI